MDGYNFGFNKLKLGFGKSMPTVCVWLKSEGMKMSERELMRTVSSWATPTCCIIDKLKRRALLFMESVDGAQAIVQKFKEGGKLNDKNVQVDFASQVCQSHFLDEMERTGQMKPGERVEDNEKRIFSRKSGASRLVQIFFFFILFYFSAFLVIMKGVLTIRHFYLK